MGGIWPENTALADAPDWLIQLLQHSGTESDKESDKPGLASLLEEPPSEGERNEWLSQVAGHYARHFDRRSDFDFHVQAAAAATDPALDINEARAVADSIWRREGGQYDQDVQQQVTRLRVRRDAERIVRAEEVGDRFRLPGIQIGTLKDDLDQPIQDAVYRIEGLQPLGGNVLLVSGYKAGKTTMTMNLARSLADDESFLDKFEIKSVDGHIAVFNYEITRDMWTRWASEMKIKNPDRIVVAHLRGAAITPLWENEYQDRLVAWMIENEIKYWICDPAAMAWRGLLESEGDNLGVAEFTAAIDMVKQRAEIPDALITHHTGRYEQLEDEERARGATRLEDWMDAGWYLTMDKSDRFLRAMGRDVNQESLALAYDEGTRLLDRHRH